MKRLCIFAILFLIFGNVSFANYEAALVQDFMETPSLDEIQQIQDPIQRFCEQVYFDAYMRRDFTDLENLICKEVFLQKMEGELLYKKMVLGERKDVLNLLF